MASRVGFLGLGVMGSKMAQRLAEGGVKLTVWNRTPGRPAEAALRALGAEVAATPAEVAARCDLTFGMLFDPPSAEAVALGPGGVAEGLRPGSTYVDCSTVDGPCGEKVRGVLEGKGAQFLAAPVSGGWRDAAAGKLLFVCGGARGAFDVAAPAMDVMGEKKWLVGPTPTHAAQAKLVLQVMMGTMISSLGESLAVADAAGIDSAAIHEILAMGAMGCPLVNAKGKLMNERSYAPNFKVSLIQKDLKLVMEMAKGLGVDVPMSAASHGAYSKATDRGLADKDFAAVREAYRSSL